MTAKTIEIKTIEIFVAMNEDGDYETGIDDSDARDRLEENWGGASVRIVKLKVTMSPPQVIEGPTVTVPDDAGKTIEAEAETGE